MDRQVWKFPLEIIDQAQPVTVSEYSRVVHVGMQANKVCLWMEVTPGTLTNTRWFSVEGTGHPISAGAEHVGSVIDETLGLVWHVYEEESQVETS